MQYGIKFLEAAGKASAKKFAITVSGAVALIAVTMGKMDYATVVLIVLAAVTVILTVLAIMIALVALKGYSEIREVSKRAAEEAVQTYIDGPKFERLRKAAESMERKPPPDLEVPESRLALDSSKIKKYPDDEHERAQHA